MTIRLGIIGAGHLGRFHAKLIRELDGVHLVGIADPLAEAAAAVAAECGGVPYADYRDLLPRIDAAIVAAPTRYHHAIGLALLERGIHVLMEKPLALDPVQAAALVESARKHQALLQVGHIERFNPAFELALPFVGRPKYVEASRCGGFTFRSTDIGVVLDLMIHDLDLTLSLIDSPVRGVSAIGVSLFGQHEDVAQARLEFANGAIANLSASRASYKPVRQMQIWSGRGQVSLDFAQRTAVAAQPSPQLLNGAFDADSLVMAEKARLKDRVFEELIPLTILEGGASNALLEEQRDFIGAIRAGRQPRVTGEQALATQTVADQILNSIAAHRWEDEPADSAPSILRGPHWGRSTNPAPLDRRRPA